MATPAVVQTTAPVRENATVRWLEAAWLLGLVAQLALVLLVVWQFQLENRTFFRVLAVAAVGFPIHAALPIAYRQRFFLFLSLVTIGVAFGPSDGAWLLVLGAGLIGVCHLPVSFGARIAILLGLGAALAMGRAGVVHTPFSAAVWPILGSMFMFRLAVYLHGLKHDATLPSFTRTFSYFFMLPNVCYPLFPVVDYTTFGRTYYDADERVIYERGVRWIARGLVHLLLYRFVYLHLTLDATSLKSMGDLLQLLISTFLLYLRVSGQFHLVVGMLHLFGFHLPETHRLYYLATSFTDFWRRINIYWKDFMMKLVYYPSFFRLRRWGDRVALVGATVAVFVITWLLHSYQWFWLRGDFPITPQDFLFWGILGILVVVTTLREARRGRKRRLQQDRRRWDASLALRTVATFATLCVLWSLWSADSLIDWLWMWSAATHVGVRDLLLLGGLLVGGLAVAGIVWDAPVVGKAGPLPFHRRPDVRTTAVLLGLLLLGQVSLYGPVAPRLAATIASIRSPALNAHDAAVQHKGYYEKLDDRGHLSAQLWNVYAQRPASWVGLSETPAYRKRNDFLRGDLRPSTRVIFEDLPLSVNRWGMRDRDYTLEKPAGTVRIAVLGPSHVMGAGVRDDETFETALADRLERDATDGRRYEVMNFGVSAYSVLQQMAMLEDRVFDFRPDVVIITDSPRPQGPVVSHLQELLWAGIPIPYPELRARIRAAGLADFPGHGLPVPTRPLRRAARAVGVPVRMPWREAELRLMGEADTIIALSLDRVAREARAHGATPVFLELGEVSDVPTDDLPMMRSAEAAGFVTLDLLDLYQGRPREAFQVAPWDSHPNARANLLIAERLYRELRAREPTLHLGLTGAETTSTPTASERTR